VQGTCKGGDVRADLALRCGGARRERLRCARSGVVEDREALGPRAHAMFRKFGFSVGCS
jgi:hypothetical protein